MHGRKQMKMQKILYKGGEGELIEKKSRFIATTRPVETEEEALAFLAEMKKKLLNELDENTIITLS